MSKRFQRPPIVPGEPLDYVFDAFEMFVNSFVADVEGRVDTLEGEQGDQRPPSGPETNLRVIRGVVNADATVAEGSGFSVADTGTGQYTITFTAAFSDVPAVDATAVAATLRSAQLNAAAAAGSCVVQTYDTAAATSADTAFHFTAIGPA